MTSKSGAIEGVVLKELVTHSDERGFFREVIRETDEFFDRFGQWSHSLMYPGTAKAWHIHQRQTDWWYVLGALKVALYDTRESSPTNKSAISRFTNRRSRHQPAPAPGSQFSVIKDV